MKKSFCITIDTEPDYSTDWTRPDPQTFESVLFGIPNIFRPIWNKLKIKPVYFVSPEIVRNDPCCAILKKEAELGAEIATHLHSEYVEPQRTHEKSGGTKSGEYPSLAYTTEIEFEKIKNFTDLIQQKFDIKPVSYRAARYGADLDTIKSLEKLGYKVDSSVTPKINWSYKQKGPDHSKAPNQPYFISPDNYYAPGDSKMLEIPITISKKRLPLLPDKWLCYRWLRPSHMTAFEMKMLVNEFEKNYPNPVLNMMFHSMEVIPEKSPFVRTRIEQKLYINRLEKTLKYMTKKGFESKTLKEIYDEKISYTP